MQTMAKRRPREKKKVWCDFAKKKYYFPQLAKCMKCDKCLKGEGHPILASEKDVKMDPVHGALNCLPCRTCPKGYFNPGRKFRCKQCRDCAGLGKTLVTPCNSTSNAVCGDTIHKGNQTEEDLAILNPQTIVIFILCLLIITTAISTIVFIYRRKRKRNADTCPVRFVKNVNNKLIKPPGKDEERGLLTNVRCSNSPAVMLIQENHSDDTPSNNEEMAPPGRTETQPKKLDNSCSQSSTSTQTSEKPFTSLNTMTTSLSDSVLTNSRQFERRNSPIPNLSIFNFDKRIVDEDSKEEDLQWKPRCKSIDYRDFVRQKSLTVPKQVTCDSDPDDDFRELSNFTFNLKSNPNECTDT